VREESFGPVLVLSRVATVAEAIERCNEVPQGLAASIHTRSQRDIARFARGVRAGVLKVNRSTAGAAASLPFGGFGLSGLGPPEHGEGDAEFHSRWQALYDNDDPAKARLDTTEGSMAEALT
jgi:acyl-CoA reductase-like NAD-dependent aldehyde dehydrogenase